MENDFEKGAQFGFFMSFIFLGTCFLFLYNYTGVYSTYIERAEITCKNAGSSLVVIYRDGDILCENNASFSSGYLVK